jgi:hypothetical protein
MARNPSPATLRSSGHQSYEARQRARLEGCNPSGQFTHLSENKDKVDAILDEGLDCPRCGGKVNSTIPCSLPFHKESYRSGVSSRGPSKILTKREKRILRTGVIGPDKPRKPKKKKKKKPKPQTVRISTQTISRAHPTKYDKYLESSHWKNFRKKYYEAFGKKCESCGGTDLIHLHHKTYERLGRERFTDMVALCSTHHADVHEYSRSNKHLTLREATDNWLAANGDYCTSTSAGA